MKPLARSVLLLAVVGLWSACALSWVDPPPAGSGGSTSSSSGATGSSSSGASSASSSSGSGGASSSGSSSGGSSGAGGASALLCPLSKPVVDAPCTDPTMSLVCEYGADPRPGCREQYSCKATGWALNASPAAACSAPPPLCDASPAGMMCPTSGAICDEGNGLLCVCYSQGPPIDTWFCDSPALQVDCPGAPYPNLGQPCSPEAVSCQYGQCATVPQTGVVRVCTKGLWSDGGSGC